MRIGFFWQGDSSYLEMTKKMVESARRVMPGVEITHFTDALTAAFPGVEVKRITGDIPMAMRRMRHHAQCEGDWLFCDTDVIFRKDVRDVFDEAFDVALTDRHGTYMDGSEYAKLQPYNMGVTFSRNGKFWDLVLYSLKNFPKSLQEWEGDQRVVCGLAMNERTPFDIVILPGSVYNFTPKLEDEDCSHASIVHYKGARKAWMK